MLQLGHGSETVYFLPAVSRTGSGHYVHLMLKPNPSGHDWVVWSSPEARGVERPHPSKPGNEQFTAAVSTLQQRRQLSGGPMIRSRESSHAHEATDRQQAVQHVQQVLQRANVSGKVWAMELETNHKNNFTFDVMNIVLKALQHSEHATLKEFFKNTILHGSQAYHVYKETLPELKNANFTEKKVIQAKFDWFSNTEDFDFIYDSELVTKDKVWHAMKNLVAIINSWLVSASHQFPRIEAKVYNDSDVEATVKEERPPIPSLYHIRIENENVRDKINIIRESFTPFHFIDVKDTFIGKIRKIPNLNLRHSELTLPANGCWSSCQIVNPVLLEWMYKNVLKLAKDPATKISQHLRSKACQMYEKYIEFLDDNVLPLPGEVKSTLDANMEAWFENFERKQLHNGVYDSNNH